MGVFTTGMYYVLKDFAVWTSTHGVPHIGMANAMWLRIFWFLVVIGSFIGFLYQFILLLQQYLSYGVNTSNAITYSDIVFPTVTICHLNPWKASKAAAADPLMNELINAYTSGTANAKFGFSNKLDTARQSLATTWTQLYGERLSNSNQSLSYNYNDLVYTCTYNAKPCNETDFIEHYDPYYGTCLQFNPDGKYVSSRASPLYGLQMIVITDQSTYLPWTESAGASISIHGKGENPHPYSDGYLAAPGGASSYGVSYVTTTGLPAPYGTCTTNTDCKLSQYSGTYDVESCFRSCLQDEIIAQCNCYTPEYPHDGANGSTPICSTITDIRCMESNVGTSSTFNVIRDCTCPQPCKQDQYQATMSTSRWPATGYSIKGCVDGITSGDGTMITPWKNNGNNGVNGNNGNHYGNNGTGKPDDKTTTTTTINPLAAAPDPQQECKVWFQKNSLLLEIYYEEMGYQVLEESPAYTLVNFISDIGGQVGLWLGMSIISLIELFTLVVLLVCYCATHRQRKVTFEELEKEIAKIRAKDDRRRKREDAMYSDVKSDPVPPPVASI